MTPYAGTVMMSFNYIIIPTLGNWFQTNPLEHELDECIGNTVPSVCVTSGKDMALQGQMWSAFVTALCSVKPKFHTGLGYLVVWVIISKIYWHLWHTFFKYTFESSYTFYPTEIMWRKMVHPLCNVTFAYIMMFHCTRAWWQVCRT